MRSDQCDLHQSRRINTGPKAAETTECDSSIHGESIANADLPCPPPASMTPTGAVESAVLRRGRRLCLCGKPDIAPMAPPSQGGLYVGCTTQFNWAAAERTPPAGDLDVVPIEVVDKERAPGLSLGC